MDTPTYPDYYNRFTRGNGWEQVMFRSSRSPQSAELNEMQALLLDKIKNVSGAVFQDGQVIDGGDARRIIPYSGHPNNITIDTGKFYLQGQVYEVLGESLTIPLDKEVSVGLRARLVGVTELDDPTLTNPAQGTDGFARPGAARMVIELRWGWIDEDGNRDTYTDWDLFPVYEVDNGVLIINSPPAVSQPIYQTIARYDREANGSYITGGLGLSFHKSDGGFNYYDLSAGVANINGFKTERRNNTALKYAKNPDARSVNNEPHTFVADLNGDFQLFTNHFPISAVGEIIGTKQVTENVVHGGFSGAIDALGFGTATLIVSVHQGGTTYVNGVDYLVAGSSIDWSPSGAEPATGSTYVVVYQYLMTPVPTKSTSTYLVFRGLVAGSTIIIDYDYNLPRVDVVAMNLKGEVVLVKGVAQQRNPVTPGVGNDQIALASITYDWVSDPSVSQTGIRAVQMWELQKIKSQIWDLYDLAALNRLQIDITSRDVSSKYGVFVDAFNGDNLRDLGVAQQAVVSDGMVSLPIQSPNVISGNNSANVNAAHTLDFTTEIVVSQPDKTGCLKINPFQAFDPLPAKVVLVPPEDHYVTFVDTIVSDITKNTVLDESHGGANKFYKTWQFVYFNVLSENSVVQAYIREIEVKFYITGFLPSEQLSTMTFNGQAVTPSALP